MKSIFLILTLVLISGVFAQDRPRVLIIGDSIYNEPSRKVSDILKNRAVVNYSDQGYNSTSALANFDKLLLGKKWDLIHFNFGFNDIMYKDPSIRSVRAMHKDTGGIRVCSEEQYEKNLRALVRRFQKTGAKVIWAETTPITGSNGILYAGDEVRFNKIAAKVMKENNVSVNYMYAHGLASHKEMPRGHGKTFNYKNGLPLHPPIVKSIVRELNLAKAVKGPVKTFIFIGDNTTVGQGIIANVKKPKSGRPGTLDELVLNPKTNASYKHLIDSQGNWVTRNDVWVDWFQRTSGELSIGFGERNNMIGPEVGFGHCIGNHFDQQVLLIKPNLKSVLSDKNFFRPKHGSFDTLIKQIKSTTANIDYNFPDYTDKTGSEISGVVICYNINEKDLKQYAANLNQLITKLRQEFQNPELPIVIVGSGEASSKKLINIQQSVAKSPLIKFVDTRSFWPDKSKSPDKSPDRLFGNAESFYKIGHEAAEAMKLLCK